MRQKSETRRQAILETAAETFNERGFEATSMSEVAARLGGSKATLYNYFPSKESLFIAVMLEKARAHADELLEAFSKSPNIEAAVRRFALDYLTLVLRPEIIATKRMTLSQGDRCGFGQMIYQQAVKPAWTAIADRLKVAMDEGKMHKSDPWTAAMHLKGLAEGGLLDECLNGSRELPTKAEIVETAKRGAEAFLRAYRP